MKRALIILSTIAIVLGIIALFVVFYGGGTYVVNSPLPSNSTYSSSTVATASSTASSTLADASSTASSTIMDASSTLAEYTSNYSQPPMTWSEGPETISITGANLSGSELTLTLTVQMGSMAECVPMNMRLVADEQGDLTAPLTTQFIFPDSETCEGTPGVAYNDQQIVFNVDPATLPLVFTTGGTSNKFFELSTTPQGGITIAPPPTSG
jgi:FlaG/FlaF family flagellin (archaellin)